MNKPIRILILEDKVTDAELLIREVKRAGYTPEWRRVETEEAFLAELRNPTDMILSDYSLPHYDGLRAVISLRERGLDIPFILVSGTLGEEAAVEAMKLGADDYLLKDRIARLGPSMERALEDKRLREERKESEKKIRAQLDELIRWQNVMLSREERIQQLKDEVNELLVKQDQPARYRSQTKP
jgi:DNA-binding NtrC family response regulator